MAHYTRSMSRSRTKKGPAPLYCLLLVPLPGALVIAIGYYSIEALKFHLHELVRGMGA